MANASNGYALYSNWQDTPVQAGHSHVLARIPERKGECLTMKKYTVVTASGCSVYESDSKRKCNAYLKQALEKGSPVGFLFIVERGL